MRVALLLLFTALQAQLPSVSGVVVRAGTSQPVPYARVLLSRVEGPTGDLRSSRADEQGRFTVPAVAPGLYRVSAHHQAYVRADSVPLAIGTDGRTGEIRIQMTPTGAIAGRVLDEYGDPVPRVYVRAVSRAATVETQTNDLGDYRLHSLVPASYVVSAEPYLPPRVEGATIAGARTYVVPTPPGPYSRGEGRGLIPLDRLLKAGDYLHPMAVAGRAYERVYFPGVADGAAATPIEVQPGAVVDGIDLRIDVDP